MTVCIYDVAVRDRCSKLAMFAEIQKLGRLFPEKWKRCDEYYVSSDGRVCNLRKQLLKQFPYARGYAHVDLGFGNWPTKVHPMVLESFVPNHWPKYYDMCDHRNRNRMDPRQCNLRWSNVFLNGLNKTGTKGYYAIRNKNGKLTGKYCVRIKVQRKNTNIGSFSSKEEAGKAYQEALQRVLEVLEI